MQMIAKSAVAVAAVPLADKAALAAPSIQPGVTHVEPDPIFAAIEAFKFAHARFEDSLHKRDKAKGQFRDEYGSLKPDAFSKEVREELGTIDPNFLLLRIRTHAEIDECAAVFPANVVAALHRELDHQTAVYAETVAPFFAVEEAAEQAYSGAIDAFVNTVPTTMAGVAAALTFAPREECLGAFLDEDGDTNSLLGSLARAARTLAGLPEGGGDLAA